MLWERIRHIIMSRALAGVRWLNQYRLLKRKGYLQRYGQGKGYPIRDDRW